MTPLRFLMSFLMLLFYCKETPSHFMCSNHCDTTIISHSCWDESANFLARGSRNGNDTSKRFAFIFVTSVFTAGWFQQRNSFRHSADFYAVEQLAPSLIDVSHFLLE